MTPDKARRLLDGTTPGPWDVGGALDGHPAVVKHRTVDGGPLIACDNIAQEIHNEADAALIVAAPTMATMIAGMRAEYAVQLTDGQPVGSGWGTYDTALEDMNAWLGDGYDARIVRRYVTEPEEA